MSEFEKIVQSMLEAKQAADGLGSEIMDLEKAYLDIVKTQKEEQKNLKLSMNLHKDLTSMVIRHIKERKNEIDVMTKLRKELINEQKEMEKLRKVVQYNAQGFKGYVAAANEAVNALKNVANASVGLVSAFGVQAITWHGLVKTTLEYNKTLFELSRAQNVSGRGMKNIGSTLAYVRKETNMSQMQFLTLANSMLKGFVGVKPDLMTVAKLTKTWGDQMGKDYESAKVLFEIQSRFPPLFDKMRQGLEVIEKINSNKGNVTTAQKSQLKGIQDQVIAMGMLEDVSSDMMDKMIQGLTPLTAGEKEYADLLAKRAELSQKAADIELDFAKAFEPLQKQLLTTASAIVGKLGEFPNATVGIVGAGMAIGVMTAGLEMATAVATAFGVAMTVATGGLVVAGAALAGTIALWSKCSQESAAAAKKVEEMANAQKTQQLRQQQILSLTAIQRKEYNKLIQLEKEEGNVQADSLENHSKIYSMVTRQGAETMILSKEYDAIEKSVEGYQKGISATTSSLKEVVSVTEEFGGRARAALQSLVTMSELDLAISARKFNKAMELTANMLGKKGIKLDLSGDLSSKMKSIQTALEAVNDESRDVNMTEDERLALNIKLYKLMNAQKELKGKEGGILRANTSLAETNMRQSEKFNNLAEQRLATERQLMESAQFGMGASVEMMQKQVNLALKLQKIYADTLNKDLRPMAKTLGNVNDEELKRIESAETIGEAESLANEMVKRTGGSAQALTQHWTKFQEVSQKSMQQQQKIYDLTKDIREGYLDAIREMSVGAGEFEKIIGTQEMGVTQLMDAVKGVTGVAKLNTMALGGLQDQAITNKGVGTQITGGYGAGGLQMIGASEQESRSGRIYNYGESRAEAERVIAGGQADAGHRAGEGNVADMEKYKGPEREAQIIGDKTYDGSKEGIIAGLKSYMGSVNAPTLAGNAPGNRDTSGLSRSSVANWSAGLSRGTKTPERASGGAIAGGGKMEDLFANYKGGVEGARRDFKENPNANWGDEATRKFLSGPKFDYGGSRAAATGKYTRGIPEFYRGKGRGDRGGGRTKDEERAAVAAAMLAAPGTNDAIPPAPTTGELMKKELYSAVSEYSDVVAGLGIATAYKTGKSLQSAGEKSLLNKGVSTGRKLRLAGRPAPSNAFSPSKAVKSLIKKTTEIGAKKAIPGLLMKTAGKFLSGGAIIGTGIEAGLLANEAYKSTIGGGKDFAYDLYGAPFGGGKSMGENQETGWNQMAAGKGILGKLTRKMMGVGGDKSLPSESVDYFAGLAEKAREENKSWRSKESDGEFISERERQRVAESEARFKKEQAVAAAAAQTGQSKQEEVAKSQIGAPQEKSRTNLAAQRQREIAETRYKQGKKGLSRGQMIATSGLLTAGEKEYQEGVAKVEATVAMSQDRAKKILQGPTFKTEVMETKSKGVTSAAEERGEVSKVTPEQYAAGTAGIREMAGMGEGMSGSGSGNGQAVVLIQLSPELAGQLESAIGVTVELQERSK